jgi:hypothetical protein
LSLRETKESEFDNPKGELMKKLEDLALEFYQETGCQLNQLTLLWTKTQVKEADRMNQEGLDEHDTDVKTHTITFN